MLSRLAVATIDPNPDQPRKLFDADKLRDLAESIRRNGLMQPITVRPMPGGRFQIVAGERRWRAHKLLADEGSETHETLLCNVRRMDDLTRDVEAIIENLQRENVTPMEEANAFGRLHAAGMDCEAIATKLGLPAFRVRWRLQLLNLSPEIKPLVEGGAIDRQQALEIAKLESHDDQRKIVQAINRGQIVGWKAVQNAVAAVEDRRSQADMFGSSAPVASEADVATVTAMERRLASVAQAVATGWKDGECVVALKVSPDRAALLADKCRALQSCLRTMERQLREAQAQASVLEDVS